MAPAPMLARRYRTSISESLRGARMPLLPRMASLWRSIAHRKRLDRDLDEELAGYLEQLAARNVRAGMTPEDARRAALAEMGGLQHVKDEVRHARVGRVLDDAAADLRHAGRMIARMPGLALVVVLSL